MRQLLQNAAERSIRYLKGIDQRSVFTSRQALENLATLDRVGSPATVASTGGRYFGFVTGGTLPAALAATWLASAWDQPADMVIASPIGAKIEEVAIRWLLDLLGLPPDSGVGFVTGATMANFTGLAAARHALLQRKNWDVEAKGLYGAPEISVVVSEDVHASLLKALSLLGLGGERVMRVPVDKQGRMIPDRMPVLSNSTIVCIQSGNVNTGAFDPAAEICELAHQSGAWVHIDGAFGLWAAAAPERAYLIEGVAQADSWALDAHKWLNVPYDSGIVVCREEADLRAAMGYSASYLIIGEQREPGTFTPEMSRRARGIEIWAALLSLGRNGLADLIERTCCYAARFAEGLGAAGYQVLNEVKLNQVLVSFGKDETTRKVIQQVQQDGTCWCSGTNWQGRLAMRISVSCWATTADDVERSLKVMLKIASEQS
jgi:glutamate/tyrosine decarboxylase-like PLP-dependent enzyme